MCLFLRGGNDSFNMLIPQGPEEYEEYRETRSDLAIAQNTLLPLDFHAVDGRAFGLHPSMPNLQSLFDSREACFVSNVGTLIEPLTKEKMLSGGKQVVPRNLFSHKDQVMQWQTSIPDDASTTGFAGRLADLLHESENAGSISMNISLSGNNLFQTGDTSISYTVNKQGRVGSIRRYDEKNRLGNIVTTAVNSIMDETYSDLFRETYAGKIQSSIDDNQTFKTAMDGVAEITTEFSGNDLSQRLKTIAQIIAARENLGMKRQVFFVNYGGWDHHDNILVKQADMLSVLDDAMSEFNTALKEINMHEQVTTFTASDFGRTLTSNGRGSDHAWGGNHIIMGGAVNGQEIFGHYPSLALQGPEEIGRGRLIPSISTDEYFAELALWFGANPADLDLLLPNIGRFYDVRSGVSPLGILS